MDAGTFQIDQLHLKVPGVTPRRAHQLANEIVHQLSGRLPERTTAFYLETLDLHLTVPQGTPPNRMADLIVEAILKRIA